MGGQLLVQFSGVDEANVGDVVRAFLDDNLIFVPEGSFVVFDESNYRAMDSINRIVQLFGLKVLENDSLLPIR